LLGHVPSGVPVYLIDPGEMNIGRGLNVKHIKKKATDGIVELKKILTQT